MWCGSKTAEKQNQPRPKNKVGKKSSGKRAKCGTTNCVAMASPSGSGFCSFHEMEALEVGQNTKQVFKCKERGCGNAATPDSEYCKECQDWRVAMNNPESKPVSSLAALPDLRKLGVEEL
jgi:hypothetical protein